MTQELIELADKYAAARHTHGTPDYNEKSAAARQALLDALEVQARMWDSLNVYCGQAERQRDDAIAERDNLLERLAASQKEGLSLRAQVEAQGRKIESLQRTLQQEALARENVTAMRDTLKEKLAAIRAQEALNRNDPLSALSIRFLVAAGHVTQEKADQAFSLACDAMEAEARKANIELPWVVRAPVVDVNAGLVEKPTDEDDDPWLSGDDMMGASS